MNENVIKENTKAVRAATAGLGQWEAKDVKYHKAHHKILEELIKRLDKIITLLENK